MVNYRANLHPTSRVTEFFEVSLTALGCFNTGAAKFAKSMQIVLIASKQKKSG